MLWRSCARCNFTVLNVPPSMLTDRAATKTQTNRKEGNIFQQSLRLRFNDASDDITEADWTGRPEVCRSLQPTSRPCERQSSGIDTITHTHTSGGVGLLGQSVCHSLEHKRTRTHAHASIQRSIKCLQTRSGNHHLTSLLPRLRPITVTPGTHCSKHGLIARQPELL